VGFEPTIAVLERAKTVRALDRSATAIGLLRKLKKKRSDLIGKRTRDILACNIQPQPTTLPSALLHYTTKEESNILHILTELKILERAFKRLKGPLLLQRHNSELSLVF
jgi:hypothetical protein